MSPMFAFITKSGVFLIYIVENFFLFSIHQVAEHKLSSNFGCVCSSKTQKQPEEEILCWEPNNYTTLNLGLPHQATCNQFPQA